jgi:protoporphyrinogen/coproporphyrinogen III oxidase
MKKVVVIGGGMSGLAAAWWLHRSGTDVTVLESEGRPGGTIRTQREGEWLIETGPNSALETTPLFRTMFSELGILDLFLYPDSSAERRYILRNGRLHALPMSPPAFLRSRLWSTSGKLRLLKEPFIGRATREESVAEFVERRLGREFLDYAINPFVAGVYAGNPEQLSVRVAFPKLYALEEQYGGLIRGMVRGARERRKRAEKAKDRAKLFSFVEGMETLPRAIANALGDRFMGGRTVVGIKRNGRGPRRFAVRVTAEGQAGIVDADAVILAVPAFAAAGLVSAFSAGLAGQLRSVFYPPVAQVFLGFGAEQIGRPLDGFGFLVPARERRRILGTIWSSTLFPGRAPKGCVALTTFVGGSRQPELVEMSEDRLQNIVADELRTLMFVSGEPRIAHVIKWERAIPQYNIGYQSILDGITALEKSVQGLFLCANYRGGIAVGDCVMSGEHIATRVRDFLGSAPNTDQS